MIRYFRMLLLVLSLVAAVPQGARYLLSFSLLDRVSYRFVGGSTTSMVQASTQLSTLLLLSVRQIVLRDIPRIAIADYK